MDKKKWTACVYGCTRAQTYAPVRNPSLHAHKSYVPACDPWSYVPTCNPSQPAHQAVCDCVQTMIHRNPHASRMHSYKTLCCLPEIHRWQMATVGTRAQLVVTQSTIRSCPVRDPLLTLLYLSSPGLTRHRKRCGKVSACRQAKAEKAK